MKYSDKEKIYTEKYLEIVGPLLEDENVKSMTTFDHHLGISTHFHSVFVSYMVCRHCIKRHYDEQLLKDITKAALLHDFYLYDWPTQKHEENHIFYHPKEAVRNIERTGIITLSPMQRNMILNHMFPMAHIPDSRGGWILTAADKYCATLELTLKKKPFGEIYNVITEENDG